MSNKAKADVLIGLQWGDEGKGKIVDVLASKYQVVARFQGGPNAGHSLVFDGKKHVLHTVPSGVFQKQCINVIGNGVVIDPITFVKEIHSLRESDSVVAQRIRISRRAHLIIPTHRLLDAASEQAKGKAKIGSTLKGIGPAYMDKTGRNGLRFGDLEKPDFMERYKNLVDKHHAILLQYGAIPDYSELESNWFDCIQEMRQIQLIDSEQFLNKQLNDGYQILCEGAQGSLLDIDFGTYPFVTSSSTTTAGACIGLGIAPSAIGKVIGIFKAYCTRVGSGPFPTELSDDTGEQMRQVGQEFGSTTGRARRCGWLDLVALKYSIMINGVTELAMMKADVLSIFDEIKICTAYEVNNQAFENFPFDLSDESLNPVYRTFPGWKGLQWRDGDPLPQTLKDYISFIETETGVPVRIVSMGPDRTQTLTRNV